MAAMCSKPRSPWPLRQRLQRGTPPCRAAVDLEGAEAAAAALAAAAASAATAEPLMQATGVPLLETLMACTLQEALVRGVQVLLLTAAVALVGDIALRYLNWQIAQPSDGSTPGPLRPLVDSAGRLRPLPLLLSSLVRQAQRLLPLCCSVYMATVIGVLLQVVATHKQDSLVLLLGSKAASDALAVLRGLTQFLEDGAEEVLVLFCAFTALDVKERYVQHFSSRMLSDQDVTNDEAVALVKAGGKLAGLAIWGGAGLVTLANYGINLRPLLASLGASSIVLGIAAQSLLRNLAAGITLYTSRPFSVGDRVRLHSMEGELAVEGHVVALQPTRTVIQGERSVYYINNGDLEGLVVENFTVPARKPTPDATGAPSDPTSAGAARPAAAAEPPAASDGQPGGMQWSASAA